MGRKRIIGLSLGTNSIGWAVMHRNADLTYTLLDQGGHVFKDGVEHGQHGEKPMVAERTIARLSRRHYFRRRLRKIELLKVLVEHGMCPYLSPEALIAWKQQKTYPIDKDFLDWQKTDEGSGKNPYRDRYECLTEKLDLGRQADRYTLGRALYHLAQRRGFLSNRKDPASSDEGKVKTSISRLSESMEAAGCRYLGEYFFMLHEKREKIRDSYTSRSEHYEREFEAICCRQGLDEELRMKLRRAIFFQRPLKSQKSQVGRCTFEKKKTRCPVSHPKYEEFRMWCFINNIKVKTEGSEEYRPLDADEKQAAMSCFFRKSKPHFVFEDIAKKIAGKDNYCAEGDREEKPYRFNFPMYTSVAGSPVTSSLMQIFGNDWTEGICSVYTRGEGKSPERIMNDVWHALYFYTDNEKLKEWAMDRLQLSSEQADTFVGICIPQGYSPLSINAINKMLPFLRQGLRYDTAVVLANLPAAMRTDDRTAVDRLNADVIRTIEDWSECRGLHKKNMIETVSDYLENCPEVDICRLDRIYHPTMIEVYAAASPVDGRYQLGSPRIPALKNPMAMRALFRLRNVLNELLREDKIDENTIVRIEFSRELNDANVRKAIEQSQREARADNDRCAKRIREHLGENHQPSDDEILKYQLWEEQKGLCPYTGNTIGLADFLGPNPKYDLACIVPRSRKGEGTRLNRILCDSRFNRNVKGTRLPAELSNHQEVMAYVETFGWKEKIDSLNRQVEYTRSSSANKDEKDRKVQRRHYLKMQLDYYRDKLALFSMTEIPEGFSRRQGSDVSTIRKYACMYLKTVFGKVSVVKSVATAEFRKMWGLQPYGKAKDRSSYSSHCIDAITIACIGSYEYDKLAQFMRDEERALYIDAKMRPWFPKPWPTFTEDVKAISESILVSHHTPSNISKHTKKKFKINGKQQYGKDGKPLYIQGDTARCSMHEQTYYAAIRKDGRIRYVVRKAVDTLEPKDIEKIVDPAVKERVLGAVSEKGFKQAIAEPIWMNEEKQIPIKKVRVYAPMLSSPIRLKKHRDQSRHEHKRFINVVNDGNYCMALYEGVNTKGKTVSSFKIVNNFTAVKYYNGKMKEQSIVPAHNEDSLPLKYILKSGMMILFYENSPKELLKCGPKELSKRLYKITSISNKTEKKDDRTYSYGRLEFRHHMEARKSSELNIKSGVWKDGEEFRPAIGQSHKQFRACVEGYDFTISTTGVISFIDRN